MAQEQDLAVHARVHDLAETVGRTGAQQGAKIVAHVQGADIQPVQAAPARHGGRIAEKGGMTVQAADPQALFLKDPGRQDAVQTAGKKHDHVRRPPGAIDHGGRSGRRERGGSSGIRHGPPSTRKQGQEARGRAASPQPGERIFRPAAPLPIPARLPASSTARPCGPPSTALLPCALWRKKRGTTGRCPYGTLSPTTRISPWSCGTWPDTIPTARPCGPPSTAPLPGALWRKNGAPHAAVQTARFPRRHASLRGAAAHGRTPYPRRPSPGD